jgi:hypothetical protein
MYVVFVRLQNTFNIQLFVVQLVTLIGQRLKSLFNYVSGEFEMNPLYHQKCSWGSYTLGAGRVHTAGLRGHDLSTRSLSLQATTRRDL